MAPNNPTNYEQCIQACAANSLCQAVSYLPNGPCYLKYGLGQPYVNPAVWGARLASVPVPSTLLPPIIPPAQSPGSIVHITTAPGSVGGTLTTNPTVPGSTMATLSTIRTTTMSAVGPTSSPVSCPTSNLSTVIVGGRQYLITCGIDYFDNDISSPLSPTFPKSYEGCLADCSSTSSCAAVAYVKGGPCYLKTGTGTGFKIDSTVIGAKLIGVLPTSTSAPATSTPSGTTVTVTTTISNTGYQCACTPTSFPKPTPVTCPADNGSTYTTTCGAKYAVECAQDRYGNDSKCHGM